MASGKSTFWRLAITLDRLERAGASLSFIKDSRGQNPDALVCRLNESIRHRRLMLLRSDAVMCSLILQEQIDSAVGCLDSHASRLSFLALGLLSAVSSRFCSGINSDGVDGAVLLVLVMARKNMLDARLVRSIWRLSGLVLKEFGGERCPRSRGEEIALHRFAVLRVFLSIVFFGSLSDFDERIALDFGCASVGLSVSSDYAQPNDDVVRLCIQIMGMDPEWARPADVLLEVISGVSEECAEVALAMVA